MTLVTFGRMFKPSLVLAIAQQTFSHGVPLDVEGMRVAFEISRTMTQAPDTCVIDIYNLGPERRLAISTLFATFGAETLALSLGYDGLVTQAFMGTARAMNTAIRSGPDIITRVEADDGGDAVKDTQITISTAGLTAKTMIEVAIAAMNVRPDKLPTEPPIVAHPSVAAAIGSALPAATTATFAAVHVGRASELLDEAARMLGVRWWIQDAQVMMARRQVPTDTLAVVLQPAMLLAEPGDDGSGVVRFESFLDPNIVPGRQVNHLGQFYRVESCLQRGDTRGGPWSVAFATRRVG